MIKLLLTSFAFIFILLDLPAQVTNGAQVNNNGKIEFTSSVAAPYFIKKGSVDFLIFGGVDYTSGSSKLSGLNVKPVSLTVDISEAVFGDNAEERAVWISCDAGYLFNFSQSKTDGVVISPNAMCVIIPVYLKVGYDYNVMQNNQQWFLRLGVFVSL